MRRTDREKGVELSELIKTVNEKEMQLKNLYADCIKTNIDGCNNLIKRHAGIF